MSYEKNTWLCGEPITTQKLKNIENGIADAVLALTLTDESEVVGDCTKYYYDRTAYEVMSALAEGAPITVITGGSIGGINRAHHGLIIDGIEDNNQDIPFKFAVLYASYIGGGADPEGFETDMQILYADSWGGNLYFKTCVQ